MFALVLFLILCGVVGPIVYYVIKQTRAPQLAPVLVAPVTLVFCGVIFFVILAAL